MSQTTIVLILLLLSSLLSAQEVHLRNLKQLTFGGENAEAYFSSDGKQLIFQSTSPPEQCDQIYVMNTDASGLRKISNGGRTTCAYFYPNGRQILYSSTHATSAECPPPADRTKGYVWPLYPTYDIYSARPDGSDLRPLTATPGYDAEATISPEGKSIVFTSDRDGDLELYRMDPDGKNVKRLTNSPGYDGGAFYSADSKKIVFRAHTISDPKDLEDFQSLLKQNLVRPTKLEIFVMDADGKNRKQVTKNGAANFCPFFHPDGKRIIFSSNVHDPSGRNFDLYMIDVDGTNLERITFDPSFDGFPMFTPDGKKLVFASNRNAKERGETNLFLADWVDTPLRAHVEYLASDELQGRLSGTEGARNAAEYIASKYKEFGLQPPPEMKDYFQPFSFTSGVHLGPENILITGTAELKPGDDFMPTGFSDDADFQPVPAIFAGYGIRANALKHDDYAGIDVKGKFVLVQRYGPEGDDPRSEFSQYYPLRYKAMIARELGARALAVIYDDKLPELKTDRSFGTAGIPVIYLSKSLAEKIFAADGKKLPDRKDPHQNAGTELDKTQLGLKIQLVREKSETTNVAGWLPASGSSTAGTETIVIGAHYDHLGLGIEGSLSSKKNVIHNGADDNASGTAALLELARRFATRRSELKRNVLFIAFSGEELGVLGSSHFVKNPPESINLKQTIAMLNMDMIGRLRDQKLIIGGGGTSPQWKELVASADPKNLQIKWMEDGYGPSDHSVFYGKEIPVLFFFTGAHSEYHKEDDDAHTLNYEGLQQITNLVERVVWKLNDSPQRPAYASVKETSPQGPARGFAVYLGTIPDYGVEVKGVMLSGVREGSPAEKAGIKAGDTIVQFGNKQIENIYDYTYALQDYKPGDVTTIVVLREGKRLELSVTLAKRQQREQ